MLNFCNFIQVFVFTPNHYLKFVKFSIFCTISEIICVQPAKGN